MFEPDDGLIADTTWNHAIELQKEVILLKARLFVAEQVVNTLQAQLLEATDNGLTTEEIPEEKSSPKKK